jgi:hypothetical protein
VTHDHHLAQIWPANEHSAAEATLQAPYGKAEDHDGWSPWVWVRMANGDLLLGTFPKGETYLKHEDIQEADYLIAEQRGDVLGGVQNVTVEHEDA